MTQRQTPPALEARPAVARWRVDPAFSAASFDVGNLLVRRVHGSVPVSSGWVDLDANGVPVAASADLALDGVSTGNKRRDADLRKPHLLDVAAAPVLRWSARDFHRVDPSCWIVPGELVWRGRSCDLDVKVDVAEPRPDGTRHASILGEVDRARLGIPGPSLLIGRRIHLRVEAQLRLT